MHFHARGGLSDCGRCSVGDQIIVIAQDDDTYWPLEEPAALPQPGCNCPPGVSRYLLL